MVMATPSPQQVGREFVRQYYTVLHEAPEILHRFYNSGSTFVHGGVDRPGLHAEEPVTGQFEIDKKIKELNFKDCHTKIRQVDSQATIGSGVVVQVTGELSNNGEPMRRFMQTFVLAPQSAKKFYVHNDIFRYQDEVYQDNSDSESEDHQPESVKSSGGNYAYQQAANDQVIDAADVVVTASSGAGESNHHHLNNNSTNDHHHQLVSDQSSATVVKGQDVEVKGETLVNGHAGVESSSAAVAAPAVPQQPPQPQRSVENKENKNAAVVDLYNIEANDVAKTTASSATKQEESTKQDPQSKDTKSSWAKIISSKDANQPAATQNFQSNHTSSSVNQANSSGSSMKFGGSGPNSAGKDGKKQPSATAAATQNGSAKTPKSSASATNANSKSAAGGQPSQGGQAAQSAGTGQQQQQASREAGPQSGSQSQRSAQSDVNSLTEDARAGRYPDVQQVFVGNLNQDLSETELKQFFGQYGKVVEVRINTNSKQPSGRRLPNYGFVVFDDKQTVDNLLGQTKSNNLIFKNDKGVEYRLNVEEKRARQGRQSGFGGGGGNSNGNGKSNRAARSSSNGSRNGPSTNGGNSSTSGKKNTNSNNNYSDTNTFISEKKREIHESHAIMEGHKNISRRS